MTGQLELVSDLEVPATQHGGIDSQQHGLVAGFFRALDQALAMLLLLKEIQLQDVWVLAARLAHGLERAGGEAAQAHGDALGPARPGGRDLAVAVRQPLHRRRRHAQWQRVAVSEHPHARVDLRDVPQHPWPDPVPRVRRLVLLQRAAAVRPFVVVVACLLVHPLVRQCR